MLRLSFKLPHSPHAKEPAQRASRSTRASSVPAGSSFETQPSAAPQDEGGGWEGRCCGSPPSLPHSPHAEEARSAVSKHEGVSGDLWILLRDAAFGCSSGRGRRV